MSEIRQLHFRSIPPVTATLPQMPHEKPCGKDVGREIASVESFFESNFPPLAVFFLPLPLNTRRLRRGSFIFARPCFAVN